MQRVGLPVARAEILKRANLIHNALQRRTRASQSMSLTSGWYTRFLGRHPVLVPRTAQSIRRVRNAVERSSVDVLFNTLAKLLIEKRIDALQVFNMDETSFTPKSTTSTVIAIRDSTSVWTQEVKPNFHMSVVAAVSAAGLAVPPLVILPGIRLLKTELASLSINGVRVTGAPKEFSNATSFKQWLVFFSATLDTQGIQKPVILILDNSSTHVDIDIVH